MAARRHATKAEVLVYVPALSALADSFLQSIVDMTATMISLEAWGLKAYDGHLNLAAHVATKGLTPGAASPSGAVTSRSIGSISTSYASGAPASAADSDFGSTSYGQIYLMLRRSVVVAPLVGRVPC